MQFLGVGALLTSLFAAIFGAIAARIAYKLAFAIALAATIVTAIAALRLALSAIWSGVSLVAPAVVLNAFLMVLPSNAGACVASWLVVDVIMSSYQYWITITKTVVTAKL
jgi:hypothetical protein